MGLTANSTGMGAVDHGLVIEKADLHDRVVALAGNPNVGKSTVFNELTGLNQHTGNWPGKTVTNAQGRAVHKGAGYIMVDIPGTYSLLAHSAEEEVARDFICFGDPDAVVVVCDATCLERNMNLVLQTIEITDRVVVCVNLMDEAKKKKIRIDFDQLSRNLGVPVVGASARSRKGLGELMDQVSAVIGESGPRKTVEIRYTKPIEDAIAVLEPVMEEKLHGRLSARWISLKLLDYDETLCTAMTEYLGEDLLSDPQVSEKLVEAQRKLSNSGVSQEKMKDDIVSCLVMTAENVCGDAVFFDRGNYNARDRKLDKILTSKWTGIPVMLLLLAVIFWITITGANYPSQLLSDGLFWLGDRLGDFMLWCGAPSWLYGAVIMGVYRVLAWVVAVMLPPMAIFFPLFTLLEDLGYLPRVAFNLDKYFKKASACGKQALTM
ncbi:ferrous iron transporter B [Oscillospiraceae bacterium NSJ-54]|uniref:Ferrous iron transporter B n=1 Tax=Zongyangia hominis TaxID=2763677 RepID=A0A926E9P5_9FIRM|nr:ferrous iron transporter B [Zongyangia hominis]MBC8569902.1 ferrous iron transporter B [Zongyangia hominis]